MGNIIEKIIATRNPRRFKFISDKTYLSVKFKYIFGKPIEWENPVTFNEKLQWLKIYDRNPQYTKYVDKYEVKKYISNVLGSEYVIPTIGVWNSFDEINFEILPKQFVLKCTHDSGGIVVCKDKKQMNIEEVKSKINQSLKNNYYYSGREWPYKDVEPKIIAEQYMGEELLDYKVFCFGGIPRVTLVCSERFTEKGLKQDFYDENWNHLDIRRPNHENADFLIQRPKNHELMKKIAAELSEKIPFVRIDFYEINEKLYFGEITFYPASGFEGFVPNEWDFKFGSWIKLPQKIIK